MVQLIARDGNLYYPPNPSRDHRPTEEIILLCVYDAGDCDSIAWPFGSSTWSGIKITPERIAKDKANLQRVLFDDRECGLIEDEEVLLPDGTSAWSA